MMAILEFILGYGESILKFTNRMIYIEPFAIGWTEWSTSPI